MRSKGKLAIAIAAAVIACFNIVGIAQAKKLNTCTAGQSCSTGGECRWTEDCDICQPNPMGGPHCAEVVG
jgi:hypothetical protein